jgi:16S rRNA C967 or C1407 C5-methylase (RsmB/RsmF family)
VHDISRHADKIFVDRAGARGAADRARRIGATVCVCGQRRKSGANGSVSNAGAISIQDEASQIVPLLLDVRDGDRVLDLCAAPGGKTPALVRGAGKSGMVVAGERHAHRLRAMREQLKRLNLIAGCGWLNWTRRRRCRLRRALIAILVDAPCSGSGTLARHPEIRWRLKARAACWNFMGCRFRVADERDLRMLRPERTAGLFDLLDGAGRKRDAWSEEVLKRDKSVRMVGVSSGRRIAARAGLVDGVEASSLFGS